MAKTTKLEKSAEKAYDKAKEAVKDARDLAKKVAKKKRPPVDDLKKDLKKAKADLATTPAKSAAPKSDEAKAGALYTPPLPHSAESDDLHAQTMISLRTTAKAKGLTGISRLNKAGLIERLERSGS
ncbi:hypothetical protein VH571_02850 [Frondihabitans sp. 4ASC-45]|uniref:hypothetical protein n=1 Tax=Frondihabitans sp. 4ASC-45 TaxID=3111636 RepID=UPI003C285D37